MALIHTANAKDQMGIVGFDDRIRYDNLDFDKEPIRQVGFVSVHGKDSEQQGNMIRTHEWQTVCSGFLVSRNVVLTAGHCLFMKDKLDAKTEQVSFWLNYNGGALPDHLKFKAKKLIIPNEWRDQMANAFDLAAIVLDRPAIVDGAKLSLYQESLVAAMQGASSLQPITVVGYPGTKMGKLYFGRSDKYQLYPEQRLLLHQADLEKGQSGGPVVLGDKIIGVHSFVTPEFNASVMFDEAALGLIKGWINGAQ
jgi:glutamyl endopeptidase